MYVVTNELLLEVVKCDSCIIHPLLTHSYASSAVDEFLWQPDGLFSFQMVLSAVRA